MYNSPALPCPLSHPSLKEDRAGAREVVLACMSLETSKSCVQQVSSPSPPLLPKQDRAGAREVVLAWMSLMCQLNEDRTLLGEARKLLNPTHLMTGGLTISG